jgi:hypothetical protein
MATKDVPDALVCAAYLRLQELREAGVQRTPWPYDLLAKWTSQHWKVCYRAMERAASRGLIDYGVSLRTGWLTERGLELANSQPCEME